MILYGNGENTTFPFYYQISRKGTRLVVKRLCIEIVFSNDFSLETVLVKYFRCDGYASNLTAPSPPWSVIVTIDSA